MSASRGISTDVFLVGFQHVLDDTLNDDLPKAQQALRAIAKLAHDRETSRTSISYRRQAGVYKRDNYTCRFCSRRTVAPIMLRLVGELFPETFGYHPNWKTNATDISFLILSTSLEHLLPVTRGGSNEPTNLRTACAMCNYTKSNYTLAELGWTDLRSSGEYWDGFTGMFPALAKKFNKTQGVYGSWLRALENPEQLTSMG